MTKTYGPYSPVKQAGSFYYVSGQIGVDPTGGQTAEDVASQTEQVFVNLKIVLETVGLNIDDVVKTTIFLTDMADFAALNSVYEKQFQPPRPARSTVGIKELPRVGNGIPLLVEIEAVAYKEQT